MSENTTTIEITEWQREELEMRKNYDGEAIKKVIGRLLNNSDGDLETPEWGDAGALEVGKATGDLQEQLDRIEAAAKEATQTAQETQHTIEGLQ
jgi:hypothetical protein